MRKTTFQLHITIEERETGKLGFTQTLETECNDIESLIGFLKRFSFISPEDLKKWSK